VLAALNYLAARARIKWPFDQFRNALIPKDGELDVDKEGQTTNPQYVL
jgi:hypothetical protein